MAGYLVLPEEACDWSGSQPGKVKPNPIRLGLIDLVRQFEQDPFPYNRRSPGVCLYSLDQFLVEMKQLEDANEIRDWPFLQEVHRRLRAVANEVSNMSTIHVPIHLPLVLGAGNQLYANHPGKRIPLWRLFGCHPTISGIEKYETYLFGDTLS